VKNSEIRDRLALLVREEKRLTKELVALLSEALGQQAWLEFGYSSLFDWLTRGFAYCPATAMRRIEAARLLRVVPEAAEKLGLAAMAKVQNAIQAQEKLEPVSSEQRVEAVRAVEGKSLQEAERVLVELFPASAEKSKREVRRLVEGGSVRHSMNLSAEAAENLKRAKEVLSHKFPNATDAEVMAYALDFFLEKKDPLREPAASASNCHDAASAAEPTSAVKRTKALIQKHEGECSYRDPRTGVKCTSRYQIQIDHIHPRALGGTNAAGNLRLLCRQHNLYEAERIFGRDKVERYRR
jgi:hypothetical protein